MHLSKFSERIGMPGIARGPRLSISCNTSSAILTTSRARMQSMNPLGGAVRSSPRLCPSYIGTSQCFHLRKHVCNLLPDTRFLRTLVVQARALCTLELFHSLEQLPCFSLRWLWRS